MNSIGILKVIALGLVVGCGTQNDDDEVSDILATPQGHWIKVKATTWLKKTTGDSSQLKVGSQKCELSKGLRISLQAAPTNLVDNHYLVNTSSVQKGCGFSQGYIFKDHVESTSGGSSTGSKVKAFFDVIGYAEGTNSRYNIRFGGFSFGGYAGHPRLIYCSGGLCSDAAGRYQFLSTTWDYLKSQVSLPSFSPDNQDKGCIQLLKNAGAFSVISQIQGRSDFERSISLTNRVWASFPGSPYGQPTKSMQALWNHYEASRNKY
jgi:muramidase (phage lysozyme)